MFTPRIYAEVLEDEARRQFADAIAQPFVVDAALMPDAHAGYSLPIGAVVATQGVVVPAWVGFDVGCGMCALKLDNVDVAALQANKEAIFEAIYDAVPVGFSINETEQEYSLDGLTDTGAAIAQKKQFKRALGSLGGGNHFIEVGADAQGDVYIIVHCGSRGVGHGLATHYMKAAHPEGKAKDGHFGFSVDSQDGKDYIQDLNWALDYALANRKEIVRRVAICIKTVLGQNDLTVDFTSLINRNHNHAVERDGVWIHRKGATHAEEGMMGVIPGNMRDGSFIVRGKGCADSLYSSSHGAGRVLGRNQARKTLALSEFKNAMGDVAAKVDASTLDESPFAYKNIFDVMALQSDLVDVVAYVRPIINIKG